MAIPAGPSSGGGGGGGTFAQIKGWWSRLPTWGKIVVALLCVGLIILVWLFIGGATSQAGGGSPGSSPASGGGGGGGGATTWPNLPPPQPVPSGPGGTDQPPPSGTTVPGVIPASQPTPTIHPASTRVAQPTPTKTSVPHPWEPPPTTAPASPHIYTSQVTPHTAYTGTVPAYRPTPVYPSSAAQIKPTQAYYSKFHTGYAPQIRSITPQMGGGSNAAAIALNNAFKSWQKTHPGGTSAEFSQQLTAAAANKARLQRNASVTRGAGRANVTHTAYRTRITGASQVGVTRRYEQTYHQHNYAPQLRAKTPQTSATAHPKAPPQVRRFPQTGP